MYSIEYLLANSNLPGPRGNLELLYSFSKNANVKLVNECLSFIDKVSNNSPEEFVGMCGIVGYSVLNNEDNEKVIKHIRKYSSHHSWRIREAVAMGIQEISVDGLGETLENIKPLVNGNPYEQRAVVAGLCEPKLLKDQKNNIEILKILNSITKTLNHFNKLTDAEDSLRKALGYGWSVVIVASKKDGKAYFEKLFDMNGKHVHWLIKENLKKNRLIKMDNEWVEECKKRLATASI